MPSGDKKMMEIAGAIQEGASAYLKRQYISISLVGIIIFVFFCSLTGQNRGYTD